MKNLFVQFQSHFIKPIFSLVLILAVLFQVQSQELKISSETVTDLEKAVIKEGSYAGTYLHGDQASILYLLNSKKEGVKVFKYSFDSDIQLENAGEVFIPAEEAIKDFDWYLPQSEVEKVATGSERFLNATAAFGSGMKIEFGKIKKHYMKGIFTTWSFESEGKLKPKTDEIWRIQPSGYKTTSDYTKLSTAYGFQEDLRKYGNPLLAPASATLLAVGVITEKVSIKNPPPTLGNRVAVLAINGEEFDETKFNIYHLPFSATVMSSGLGQNENLSVLFAPLNAPSTLKSHQHFRWKDNKDHFTMMRFSDDYQLVDSVSFNSKMLWGKFHTLMTEDATLIAGIGKSGFDGWARNADMIGLKNFDAIQMTKIKDGEVIYNQIYSEDELESKMVVPEGEKKKYKLTHQHNYISRMETLPNGDDLLMGQTTEEIYALQISPQGELKAYYSIGRIDIKNSIIYNQQLMVKGDHLYLVLNEQPRDLSNNTKVNKSSSTISAGGMSTTHTTTTIKRLNEVFVQSKILDINTKDLSISNAITIDGKDYYTMGSFPALFTKDAIYFSGRKGPKGKKIHLLRIDL